MKSPVFVAMRGNDDAARQLAGAAGQPRGPAWAALPRRRVVLRLLGDVHGREVIIVCTLSRADEQLMPLPLAAAAAREHGACSVALVAP